MCLTVPNPVVSEELRLDRLYVEPNINVLRETTNPRDGLEIVKDQITSANVPQCRQLFYTKAYKCRQIYLTGDAGIGKTIFCKHLVDLWCKADSEIVTNGACSSVISGFESRDSEYCDSNAISSGDSDSEDELPYFHKMNRKWNREKDKMEKERMEGDSDRKYVDDSEKKIIQDDGDHEYGGDSEKIFSKEDSDREEDGDSEKKRIKEDSDRKDDVVSEEKRMKEDMGVMAEFKLLFYITLRESPNMYHVADMIDSQILQQVVALQHFKASVLLQKVPCLVIIDGLDEWVCPTDAKVPRFVKHGIPGRDWLENSTVFLTTSRSWKLEALQFTSKEMDKQVDLVGLSNNSSETLCNKIIKLLEKLERVHRTREKFQAKLQEKGLSHFRNKPVILTQLICLWFDKQDLGSSQVQLYCSMLEMLLKRADKNLPEQTCISAPETSRKERLLPECFFNHQHCQAHQHILVSLGKVAFEALFNQKREHALVFESSQMEISGIEQNNIDLCLKSGILSQSKVLGKRSVSEKKLSFLHKKVQEFLAAIFITYCENAENAETVKSRVMQFCTTIESMLEMSQVWVFVSGIRPDLAKQMLTDLMTDVVLKDTRVLHYRQTLTDVLEYPAFTRSMQTCIENCVIEARSNGHIDLCFPLEDFVIDRQTISARLEQLLRLNKVAGKSVYIDTNGMTRDSVNTIMYLIKDTNSLQKLHLDDRCSFITNMEPLRQTLASNKNNLKSLKLRDITLTSVSPDAVFGTLTHVRALQLCFVTMTHTQIEQLLFSVSQARNIRQLQLERFNCTVDGRCCRPMIDLSGHTQLNSIVLAFMNVEHLPAVTMCVEYVRLWCVMIADSHLRQLIHELSSISHKLKVELLHVTVTGDSENPVDLFDIKHNNKLVVTMCKYNDKLNRWSMNFHTQ